MKIVIQVDDTWPCLCIVDVLSESLYWYGKYMADFHWAGSEKSWGCQEFCIGGGLAYGSKGKKCNCTLIIQTEFLCMKNKFTNTVKHG